MKCRQTTVLASALSLLGLGLWLYSKRVTSITVAGDLRSALTVFRTPGITPALLKLMQPQTLRPGTVRPGVRLETRVIAGEEGQPEVTLYLYLPRGQQSPAPAVFYTHGGGFILSSASSYHHVVSGYAADLGIPFIATEYRLSPKTPFPGALNDLYAALKWTFAHAAELGIDTERIALAGESAGGGLSASLAQLAHDRQEVRPAFQALIYPMLDDRTVLKKDTEGRGDFVWSPASNRTGWTAYLGHSPGEQTPSAYAAAARREDLSGLPPAWIACGTLDLFYPEDLDYARRLQAAGVPCEWAEIEGAFHGFDMVQPKTHTSQAFRTLFLAALRRGLGLGTDDGSEVLG